MFRRSVALAMLLALSAVLGCTTTAPFITGLTGLPSSIIIPATVVLTASGGPGSSRGLFTWTFSTNCGGTFTSTTTPNNGPANPITIGPTDATTVQVTYDSTSAIPGACTFTVKLVTSSGRSAMLQVTTTIWLPAGLSLTKGDSPDPVLYGNNVTYTLTVTNSGPGPATNVVLTDTLPANMVFVSATPSQGSCSGTTTITCNLGTINNGANATVTIVVQAKAAGIDLVVDDDAGTCTYTGTVTDTATVTATEPDPVPGDNTATADTAINANYATISAAIAAASTGQKIFVCLGTYTEQLSINKALTLIGASSTNTIIQGTGSDIVTISSGNVTIQGFQITTSLNNINLSGIKLAQLGAVSNVTITDNWIRNLNTTATYAIGISLQSQNSNVSVLNNQIENITSNGLAYGILLSEAGGMGNNNVLIKGNQVSAIQGALAGIGISVNDDFHNVTVEGNTVSNLTSPGAGKRVVGIASGGTAGTPSNVTILNNTVSNITWTGTNIQDAVGIGIGDTAQGVTIQNNTVSNCGVGIGLATSGINIVINNGNDILNNQVGIGIATAPQAGWAANYNNIVGNALFGAQNTTATSFNAENNWWGCTAGPGNPGCDTVSFDNVDFTPWLTAPVP